jgi:hypothetical protein
MKIQFGTREYDAIPRWARYRNGRFALELIDAETGEPLYRVSSNLVDAQMASDEMALNHDFVDVVEPLLVKEGLIAANHRTVRPSDSFVSFHVCRVIGAPQGV